MLKRRSDVPLRQETLAGVSEQGGLVLCWGGRKNARQAWCQAVCVLGVSPLRDGK